MKLAELLAERSDLQNRYNQMSAQLPKIARIQEGDEKVIDPHEFLKEMSAIQRRLTELIIIINRVNIETVLADGKSLMEKIAMREELRSKSNINKVLLDTLISQDARYSRQEIRYVNTIDAAEVRAKSDKIFKALRDIDNEIQAANWTVEVTEN